MSEPFASPVSTILMSICIRHKLLVFFILVFALTWPLQIVDALGSHGLIPVRVPLVLQVLLVAYMPTVAASIMTYATQGKVGVIALLKKLLIWRVGLRWYVFAIAAFAAICAAAVLLSNVLTGNAGATVLGPDAAQAGASILIMAPALFLVTTLINGEELAWRGYALPRLQARWSALQSSLILGLVWILFHIPMWLTFRGYPLDFVAILSWSAQLLAASVIFTWLFNHTRGSVLLSYLLHGSVNTWTRVFAIASGSALAGGMMTLMVSIVALALVTVYGGEHLLRHGQRQANLGCV